MTRRRRPAAETRAEILDAARELLMAQGPARLRLDDVASDVGISRQAVLHHFGSREGLMRAVVERAWSTLFADLSQLRSSDLSPDGFLDSLDDVVRRQGNARLGAWLLLSGKGLPDTVFDGVLADLPDRIAADVDRPVEDVRYGLLLAGATMFGDAVFGERLRHALDLPDDESSRQDFRRWLASRME